MADLGVGVRALTLAWEAARGERVPTFVASDGPMSVEVRASRWVAPGARASWTWTVRVGFCDDGGFALGGATLKLRVNGGASGVTEDEAKAVAERVAIGCRDAAALARITQTATDTETA